MPSKITPEMRRKALQEDYKNRDKSSRTWYIKTDELEELGIQQFTPDEGPVFISVLPRWEDPRFYKELFIHYNIGPDNNAFLCLDKMFGKSCPICQYGEELRKAGEPDDIWKTYRPNYRYLMWIVNVESKRTIREGPMLYDAPRMIRNGILDICSDARTGEIIDPSEPESSVNIVFKRHGKKGNQRTEYKGFKLEDRDDVIPEEFYDLPNMEELIIEPEPAEMKKCLGIKEEEEKPVRRFTREATSEKKDEKEDEEEELPFEPKKLHSRKSEDDTKPVRRFGKREEEENENDEEKEEKSEVMDRVKKRLAERRKSSNDD